MSDIFTQPTEQVTFLPNRSIGPFQAQVTIEEVCNDSLEITNHPVEQGASITDHAYVNPSSLNISALFSEDQDPLPEIYQNLLIIQNLPQQRSNFGGRVSLVVNCLSYQKSEKMQAFRQSC